MAADIDIDFADRQKILDLIQHVTARQQHDGQPRRHNSGVYVTEIPRDAVTGMAAIDYEEAEQRGYFKLDFLNMTVYQAITDHAHYNRLLDQAPDWHRFNQDREFFQQLVHVSNHWDTLHRMPEPVDSLPRLAMFLAVIRPGKRHLIGLPWIQVAEDIWTAGEGYSFKKSHAVAYARLVTLHMNIMSQPGAPA